MFMIPELKSTITLFVINADFYQPKDPAQSIRVTVQALVLSKSRQNKKGFSVVEYRAEPEVYQALDFSQGPCLVKFETETRELKDGFGNMANQEYLCRVLDVGNSRQSAKVQPSTASAAS